MAKNVDNTAIQNVSLAICTPIPGEHIELSDGTKYVRRQNITVDWHRSRQCMIPPFCTGFREICIDGYEVGVARNMAAKRCLETKCDFLFFLDWDVLIPPATLHTLMTHAANYPDHDIFSGLYCCKMNPPHPLIYKAFNGKGVHWAWTKGDLITKGIYGVPMGCALIRTSVFKRLKHTDRNPWFKTTVRLDKKSNTVERGTEDLWFTKRVCEEIGKDRIVVDTDLLCEHIDNNTGLRYKLPENSLPWRRLKEKKRK